MNSPDCENAADLILHNARVITFNPEQPHAELVAIRGNRILATGGKDDLAPFRSAATKLIDCAGGTLIPGFNDAHCHPISLAVSLLSIDCSPAAVRNIAEIQACIRQQAGQTEEGKWLRAAHYDEYHLDEKRPPNRWELDQASPRHPLILVHHTAGNCVLNSIALQLAGITRDTPDPPGGTIHRDPASGEPDGLISGRNAQVERVIPSIGEAALEQGMKLANRVLLSQGITSVQDTGWNNGWRHWQTWQRLIEREATSLRVSMLLGTAFLEDSRTAGLSMGSGGDRLRVGGIKLALDESTGCAHPPQQDINQLALRACRAGYCVAFHVSDIPMLEASLAAIKFVSREFPAAQNRFRLEHCTLCPPGLLLKIKASGAIVVTQPAFLSAMGQQYLEQAAPDQASWFQPSGSFLRWGVKVAFSSDSPLMPSNPLAGICAAVTRKTAAGQSLAPQEGISTLEALQMYTQGGAQASFEAEIKGSIRAGMLADLALFSEDLAQIAPEQLPAARVVRCIVNGKVAWEA